MTNSLSDELKIPLTQLLLSIADDKLMLGHRASDWTGLGPILEEDIAFSAISQEEIAHASALYEFLAGMNGERADAIAFGRTAEAYRCASLTVLPDDFDWAKAIARQFFCDHFDLLRLRRLSNSNYKPISSLAKRICAEEATHVEHADTWIAHLGQGDDESKARMQKALDELAPHAALLFEGTEDIALLEKEGIYPVGSSNLFSQWEEDVSRVAKGSGLRLEVSMPDQGTSGGRHGEHGEGFASLLDEMCEVFRVEPEAAW